MAINTPGIEELKKKTGSSYTLVTLVSQRTRQILEGAQALVDEGDKKPITIAIEEINKGLVSFQPAQQND